MSSYYTDIADELVARFDQEIGYWLESLRSFHGNEIAEGLSVRLRARYKALLPTLPYIGGSENKFTLSLLDAARCLTLFRELQNILSVEEIGLVLFRAIQLRQEGRGTQFYQQQQQQYTPEQVTAYRKRQAQGSQTREYSGDYVYEYVEEEGYEYGYDFEECGALKLFKAHDAMEFLPFFCYLDYPKMKNSGLRMIRTKSLSTGHTYCNHRFRVGKVVDVPWPPPFVNNPQRLLYQSIGAAVRNGTILMVHMASDRYDFWTLPGGGIEIGETPEEAVIREMKEETNLVVKNPRFLFQYDAKSYGKHIRHYCFQVEIGDGEPVLGLDPELPTDEQVLKELEWKSIDDYKDDVQVSKVIAALNLGSDGNYCYP